MFSVILPIGEDLTRLDRTIQSARAQTTTDWELLAVDFASQDGRNELLQASARRDPRIRVGCIVGNRCAAAARNAALRRARGNFVAYLEPGDEFYPDYLVNLVDAGQDCDLMVSRLDVRDEDGCAVREIECNPAQFVDCLFAENIVPRIAVAHRRSVLERVGVFNELLCRDEMLDLLKRSARTGLRFKVLPTKCGRRRATSETANSRESATPHQRQAMALNWQAGRPLYFMPGLPLARRKIETIAFVSPHCVLDQTNGAAITTRDGLRLLAENGFRCEAFCGTRLDESQECLPPPNSGQVAGAQRGLQTVADEKVDVTLCDNHPTSDAQAFLSSCEESLQKSRPHVVWTYGGDPTALAVQRLAKRLDIPVLFALHNFAYGKRDTFEAVDLVVVPSDFSRRYYMEKLGVACQVLPNVVNWKVAEVANRKPRYVTFINPKEIKGVYVFARIARELARRRPNIPILVTQGRSRADALRDPALGLTPHILGQFPIEPTRDGRNITTMRFTPEARAFSSAVYSQTKLLLMPSLWLESFGLVAAEAMLNCIPVLASNRGALPETIGDAGFLFDIPARYTPDTRELPTAEEVAPWVETIIRLWDDVAEYNRVSVAARERASRWHPDRLAPIYRDFFSRITHQPAPPLMPLPSAKG